MSDVNPVQKDVSASKTIQEDVMDLSLHLLNRFPASGDDYMVPSPAEKANNAFEKGERAKTLPASG